MKPLEPFARLCQSDVPLSSLPNLLQPLSSKFPSFSQNQTVLSVLSLRQGEKLR